MKQNLRFSKSISYLSLFSRKIVNAIMSIFKEPSSEENDVSFIMDGLSGNISILNHTNMEILKNYDVSGLVSILISAEIIGSIGNLDCIPKIEYAIYKVDSNIFYKNQVLNSLDDALSKICTKFRLPSNTQS